MFSLCIATMNRFDSFLSKYLVEYLKYEWVDEIVITDENGDDVRKIEQAFPGHPKLRLFTNEKQLGALFNKLKACSLAKNEWIALLDSDNFASASYFEKAKEYIENVQGKNVILAPARAKPFFNFQPVGPVLNRSNSKAHHTEQDLVLLNTGNYVLNKYLIDHLDLSGEEENLKHKSPYDVIYLNTLFLEQLDVQIHVVDGMEYDHVLHNQNLWVLTHQNFHGFYAYVKHRYFSL